MGRKKAKARTGLKEVTRRHILDSVVRAITRVGFQGLTMDQVAQEAGIAKGTVYLYFTDKDELVHETIDTCLAPLLEDLFAILDSDEPPETRLRRFTRRHLQYFEARRGLFRVLLHERARAQFRTGRRSSSYRKLVGRTAQVIALGMEEGVFRRIDSKKLAGLIVDANISVISHRLFEDSTASAEEDAGFLSGVFLNGILSGTGGPGGVS